VRVPVEAAAKIHCSSSRSCRLWHHRCDCLVQMVPTQLCSFKLWMGEGVLLSSGAVGIWGFCMP
jgi:hypothetical protein